MLSTLWWKASQENYEGRFIDFQIKRKVERWIIVSRRSLGECACRWRFKTSFHPFILPKEHNVTELIICYHYEKLGHLGQKSVLSSLGKRFWVVNGRSAVRRVLKNCMECGKRKAPSGQQLMAKIPQVNLRSRLLDFFSPIEVKKGRSTMKRFGWLFVLNNPSHTHWSCT